MKTVKITLLLLSLVFCVCVLFTACGGENDPADDTSAEATNQDTAQETNPEETTVGATEETTVQEEETTTVDMSKQAARETESFDTKLEITEKDGKASVKTSEGLEYTASGYKSVSDGKFVINTDFSVTFAEGAFDGDFNRIRLQYTSDHPLKFFVNYTEDGKLKSDYYFAEAGTDLFCGVISDYLKKKSGCKVTELVINSCDGQDAKVGICGFATQTIDVYSAATYYIDSNRYKLGLNIKWGGTVNFLKDKNCPIDDLGNLVNMHDSGRLIQQSYYGTREAVGDFKPGRINNEDWMYNPVQAGDYLNNGSRIIDIVPGFQSLYIKIQPMDWGQAKWLCPAYMENVYTVTDEYIKIDNRYVDFSNIDHPMGGQELPALYTVSYFNEYVWYNGDKPWTGDTLSRNNDIEMVWTQTEHLPNFGTYTKVGNTETWGALVSAEDDYGLGVFVPNVDHRSAAVFHPQERTKSASADSCSYIGPSNLMRLVSYDPLEYSYMITTGSVDEIRGVFTKNKDFTTNPGLSKNRFERYVPGSGVDFTDLDLTDAGNMIALSLMSKGVAATYDREAGMAKFQANQDDPYFHIDFSKFDEKYSASDYTTFEFEYMIPEEFQTAAQFGFELFLCTGDQIDAAAGKSVKGSYVADGQFHTAAVDLSKLSFWEGDINKIRLDFFNIFDMGDYIYIKSIRLS